MASEQYRPLTPERLGGFSQDSFEKRVSDLIVKLKRRELLGAYAVGRQVAKLFAELIANCGPQPVWQLMKRVREEGRKIQAAQPLEFTIGCIVRRVLAFIREGVLESKKHTAQEEEGKSPTLGHRPRSASLVKPLTTAKEDRHPTSSLSDVFSGAAAEDFSVSLSGKVKKFITTSLEDMLADMKGSHEIIALQAEQHIHTNEVVLTYGRSRTVFDFLMAVHRVRNFEVIVAESSPSRWGHRMAKDLAEKSLSTTLITDSAVFAMMARVNIVIIGTHAVLANGGLIAHTGSHLIALAAKHYSVPVVVCSGLYKLCPLYAFDQDTFQDHNAPTAVLPFTEADDSNGQVEVLNPSYDYIPPELISLFVTNDGTYAPAYIYRQLAEFYHRDDYDLDDDSFFKEKEEMRR